MALFSRRPKQTESADAQTPPEATPPAEVESPATDAPVPEVSISLTTFGEPGKPATLAEEPTPQAPAARPERPAPRPRRSVPGLPENTLLADALGILPPKPASADLLNVARQLLQGRVYVRVRGDARELLAGNQPLPMAVARLGEQTYVLAFSGGDALQAAVKADGDGSSSAIALPVEQLLRRVVDGDFGGIALDHASAPAAAVLPRALLEKALADLDETQAVKSALVGERTDETVAALVTALTTTPVWVAARRNEDGRIGVSEVRTPAGERMLELFSHPLELHVLGRGDQSVRIAPDQLAKALAEDEGLLGVIVNPHGPWMRLSREDLAPLIATASA